MVYSEKFVMCVLHNGQVQKELKNNSVTLPFGSEYALRFRNKNNRRALVKFTIDGEEMSGGGFVIPANSHIDIQRPHNKDAAFQFVSLESSEAHDHGKNGPNPDKEKGLIEAHFYLEKETPKTLEIHHHHHHDHYPQPLPLPYYPWQRKRYDYGSPLKRDGSWSGISKGGTRRGMSSSPMSTCSVGGATPTASTDFQIGSSGLESLNDGCTVEGAMTGQRFSTAYIDVETTYTVLKIFLQGFEPKVEIQQAAPAKKTNKAKQLEDEQEALRIQLLEAENAAMRKKLAELQTA